MKTDLYTKGILTVIAVALMVIAFKNFPPIAIAEPPAFNNLDEFRTAVEYVVQDCEVRGQISREQFYNGEIVC